MCSNDIIMGQYYVDKYGSLIIQLSIAICQNKEMWLPWIYVYCVASQVFQLPIDNFRQLMHC